MRALSFGTSPSSTWRGVIDLTLDVTDDEDEETKRKAQESNKRCRVSVTPKLERQDDAAPRVNNAGDHPGPSESNDTTTIDPSLDTSMAAAAILNRINAKQRKEEEDAKSSKTQVEAEPRTKGNDNVDYKGAKLSPEKGIPIANRKTVGCRTLAAVADNLDYQDFPSPSGCHREMQRGPELQSGPECSRNREDYPRGEKRERKAVSTRFDTARREAFIKRAEGDRCVVAPSFQNSVDHIVAISCSAYAATTQIPSIAVLND